MEDPELNKITGTNSETEKHYLGKINKNLVELHDRIEALNIDEKINDMLVFLHEKDKAMRSGDLKIQLITSEHDKVIRKKTWSFLNNPLDTNTFNILSRIKKIIFPSTTKLSSPELILDNASDEGKTWMEVIIHNNLTRESFTRPDIRRIDASMGWFNPKMLSDYGLNGIDLLKVNGIDITLLVEMRIMANEMKLLELNVSILISKYNMNADNFLALARWIDLNAWINDFGFNKETYEILYKQRNDLLLVTVRYFNWDINFLNQHLQLPQSHLLSIGFSMTQQQQ